MLYPEALDHGGGGLGIRSRYDVKAVADETRDSGLDKLVHCFILGAL